MERIEAYKILTAFLKNPNLIKHCLATEAAMRALCVRLIQNPGNELIEKWGLTGLLHDADYELVNGKPEIHGILITEKIELPEDVAYAIRAHNWQNTKIMPQTSLDWAIACSDQLTGLIVAATFVNPTKKLSDVTPEFVMKRYYEKAFARGADRTSIILCEEKLGIPLLEFITIVLASMQQIPDKLGL